MPPARETPNPSAPTGSQIANEDVVARLIDVLNQSIRYSNPQLSIIDSHPPTSKRKESDSQTTQDSSILAPSKKPRLWSDVPNRTNTVSGNRPAVAPPPAPPSSKTSVDKRPEVVDLTQSSVSVRTFSRTPKASAVVGKKPSASTHIPRSVTSASERTLTVDRPAFPHPPSSQRQQASTSKLNQSNASPSSSHPPNRLLSSSGGSKQGFSPLRHSAHSDRAASPRRMSLRSEKKTYVSESDEGEYEDLEGSDCEYIPPPSLRHTDPPTRREVSRDKRETKPKTDAQNRAQGSKEAKKVCTFGSYTLPCP